MDTATRFVFLMHPKEFKREKAGTGRLAHLCLRNSELAMGLAWDRHPHLSGLLQDPAYFPMLLYPGPAALDLSAAADRPEEGGPAAPADPEDRLTLAGLRRQLAGRRLAVLLLDGTWSGARKMLKLSPGLQRLPRLVLRPSAPSRFVIKQQPAAGCLSTLEAVHELMLQLEQAGLDRYPDAAQLLEVFGRMQAFQLRCAADPARGGYRHRPYRAPEARRPARAGSRRSRYAPLAGLTAPPRVPAGPGAAAPGRSAS